MNSLYNISIQLYVIAIRFAALFNAKAKLWVNGRKNIFQKIEEVTKGEQNIVWFHCASLGEFEQGKPIIEGYKQKYPSHKILLTFFSPSGFEIRKNYEGVDWVFYLPADTKSNAKKFISIVKPIKVIFIKYEFWFNYMAELKKQNISFYSVSAIFRDGQAFFKYNWFANQLKNITHFFVQDKTSADLLKSIGLTNHTISGDSRFDSVLSTTQNPKSFPLIKQFCKTKPTIICGSTWLKDETLLSQFIKENPQYNYIIAPHEMHHISHLQKQTGAQLFSTLNTENINSNNVLIIDSIGILSSIYQYANIAYIGGGFGSGIHNILEAITFGLPVIFGPNYKKFNEAKDLIAVGGSISIANYQELNLAIKHFNIFDRTISTDYIRNQSGATEIILESL
jgi:3-deoxy-D-manno-octulosonic-acid transferase